MTISSDRVIIDVKSALRAPDVADAATACRAAVEALGRHTPALVAALLHVRDHLRCVAATGSWRVYASVPLDRGVVGRVFRSGRMATVTDVAAEVDYIPLGPGVVVEICVPLTDSAGRSVGALNIEWTSAVDVPAWQEIMLRAGRLLSERIEELGHRPTETYSEKLLRHAHALTAAGTETQLRNQALEAARELSGLRASVLLVNIDDRVEVWSNPAPDDAFAADIADRLAAAPQRALHDLVRKTSKLGASYSLGDPTEQDASGFEELTAAGVRTMIAIPAGPKGDAGVLLMLDRAATHPDPATVNLLALLSTHAWATVEQMRTLRQLHRRASSDPLTGLRHHGSLAERLAGVAPGRTALVAIDVDAFKVVNDTYGHQEGDRILIDLARALQATLRTDDELYRIGGDEFVAVLDVRGCDEARGVAERLCAAARITGRTISAGVALQMDGEAPELTLRRADTALYEAKRTGRDCVAVASLA